MKEQLQAVSKRLRINFAVSIKFCCCLFELYPSIQLAYGCQTTTLSLNVQVSHSVSNRALYERTLRLNVQVSHRVSDLVLENHAAYATELERVMDLERTLLDASAICMASRR
jgi:hypothetical protein